MNPTTPTIDRRNVLKGLGGATGAALLGAGGLAAFSGSATATAAGNLDAGTVSSDDGSVEYVAIYGDSVVEWDGFDTEATHFSIAIEAEAFDSGGNSVAGPTQLSDTGEVDLSNSDWGNYDESLSGPGTSGTIETGIGLAEDGTHDPTIDWHVVGTDPDGYGLPENSLPASALSVDTDGASEDYTIEVRSTYTWYDSAGGSEIFSKTFTTAVDVTVNNEATSSTASNGDGDDGATAA